MYTTIVCRSLIVLSICLALNIKTLETSNSFVHHSAATQFESFDNHGKFINNGDAVIKAQMTRNKSQQPYKPIVIIHGVMTGNKTLESFAQRIKQIHPGTEIIVPDEFSGWASLEPMWKQVIKMGQLVMNMSGTHPNGIHLIGYSQGGLIARCILEQYPNHNVRTFISLSSPQGGQYGTKFLHIFFPELVRERAFELFYSSIGQYTSVGNYWNDPHHQSLFFKYNTFLPFVNNLNATINSLLFKKGLLKLNKMVLIGGPNDTVITPWQSSQFGHFNENETVVELKDTIIYKTDSLGLKQLEKEKKLHLITVPGIDHYEWHSNWNLVDNHIIPYLD